MTTFLPFAVFFPPFSPHTSFTAQFFLVERKFKTNLKASRKGLYG
jgi:hypothetical protein